MHVLSWLEIDFLEGKNHTFDFSIFFVKKHLCVCSSHAHSTQKSPVGLDLLKFSLLTI